MNCKEARLATGLWVGGDLDPQQVVLLEVHLAECPACKERARRVRQAVVTLENDMNSPLPQTASESLWPELSPKLLVRRRAARVRRYNSWVGSLAVAATLLACVAIHQDMGEPVRTRPSDATAAIMPVAQPVVAAVNDPSGSSLNSGRTGIPVSNGAARRDVVEMDELIMFLERYRDRDDEHLRRINRLERELREMTSRLRQVDD